MMMIVASTDNMSIMHNNTIPILYKTGDCIPVTERASVYQHSAYYLFPLEYYISLAILDTIQSNII